MWGESRWYLPRAVPHPVPGGIRKCTSEAISKFERLTVAPPWLMQARTGGDIEWLRKEWDSACHRLWLSLFLYLFRNLVK